MEAWTIQHTLGDYVCPYACDGDKVYVYRLAADEADHYFFINDHEAQAVNLYFRKYNYRSVSDPISGEALKLDAPIELDAFSGKWLRFEK